MRVQSDEATLRDINTSSHHRLSSPQPAKPPYSPRSAPRVPLVANIVLNVALVLLPLHRPLLRENGVRYPSTRLHHQSDRLRGLCRSNLRKLAVSSYPHDRLPSHSNTATSGITLAPSNLSAALLIRDGPNGCREQLQVAHVVPQAELDWWRINDMSRYNTGSAATLDDPANALLLRADIHIAYDKPRVALIPKLAIDGSMQLVCAPSTHPLSC